MAKSFAQLRYTSDVYHNYSANILRNVVKDRDIWPLGCDIVTAYLEEHKLTSETICLRDIFKAHYNELYDSVVRLRSSRTHFSAIPRDCINAIMDAMVVTSRSVDKDNIASEYRTVLLGETYSHQGRPSRVYWHYLNCLALHWDGRGIEPYYIEISEDVRFVFTYNPHTRGKLLEYGCVSRDTFEYYESGYEDCDPEYTIICSREKFTSVYGSELPKTLDEAAYFLSPLL